MRQGSGYRIALAVLGCGITVLLVGPFLVPVPPLEGLQAPEDLADPDSQFIDLNGLQVHCKTMGEGEPAIVLMHGFAASLYSWNAVMEPLSHYGTVIAYDRVGFGLTERPMRWGGQNPYSSDAQIELVIDLLDHYGIQTAILVGHSAGGALAMQTKLAHPGRIQALILVDAAVYRSGGAPQWLQPLLATPQMRHLGPLISRQLAKRGPQLINLAWHNPALVPPEMLEYYQKPLMVKNWDRALWEFTLASRPSGLSAHLSRLTLPVLVITGDDDRIVPPADSIRLAKELPNASLEVIFSAGHLPQEEQPGKFLEVVANFLNTIKQ